MSNQLPADIREDRRAEQWVRSILAYLEWRAGLPWVNYTRYRFHPQVENYVTAIRCVRECWYEPEKYIPKKLPQSVREPAAEIKKIA